MPIDCNRSTSGGKGNIGMFLERDPLVCAAGISTAQPDTSVADCLQHYLLKDEADALISDALIPPPEPRPLPPLRHPIPVDTRYAGPFNEIAKVWPPIINTKFQTIVDDLKDTVYASYWKKRLGRAPDPTHMFPEGFDINGTTYGEKTPHHGRLYDIVMPKVPYPDNTPPSKRAGAQKNRHYCEPPFDADLIYGHRSFADKRGIYGKCCLTDPRVFLGTASRTPLSSIQSGFKERNQSVTGAVLAPNDNLKNVPNGYAFGVLKPPDNLPETLTTCVLNAGRDDFKRCLRALNTLRKILKTRFLPTFFHSLYLDLKYLDKNKTGWIPNKDIYRFCAAKFIRFDPALIEPLLSMWRAFDGSNIKYETFVTVINARNPLPEMPKVPDVPDECLDFRTTYSEMVKSGLEPEPKIIFRAGLPSGRYFDTDYPVTPRYCCKAHRTFLPEESDMKSCINPTILTLLHVNHRDMYEKREPEVVRRVFEAGNDKFTDDLFNTIWEAAKKYHSQGWVCYETFRQALNEITNPLKQKVKNDSEYL